MIEKTWNVQYRYWSVDKWVTKKARIKGVSEQDARDSFKHRYRTLNYHVLSVVS